MYRVVIPFAVFICVMGTNQEIYDKCKLVIENDPDAKEKCCNDFVSRLALERFKDSVDKTEDCLMIPSSAEDCERENCFAQKFGFLTESGKVDSLMVERVLIELNLFGEGDEMLDLLRGKCIYTSDRDAFGMEGACELKKLHNCIHTQMLFQCTHWKTSEHCVEFHKVAEECAGLL